MDTYCESTHSSLTSAASSSPYQTPSPRTSMSFEERQAQIAYPTDASTKILYAEPQPIYHSPGYISEENQWSSPAISDAQCAPAYLPEIYGHSKLPSLVDSRRSEGIPRGLMQQSEWSDVGPFNLPPYSQQPPAYVQSQQQMYGSTLVGVSDLAAETRGRFAYSDGLIYNESLPPSITPRLDDVYPDPASVLSAPIKTEPTSSVVVPTQSPYYSRPPSVASSLSSGPVPPHHIVHVVFTDDAASKETQYLRRRCHNCQQVEPPAGDALTWSPERSYATDADSTNEPTSDLDPIASMRQPPAPAVTQFTVKQEAVSGDLELDSRRGSVASSLSGSASSPGEWEDSNYNTSLVAGNVSRLSPSQQHSPGHEGGVQRGAAHFMDSTLAARFRAGRKSATAPYDAFSATRMGPPTPPLVPTDGPSLLDAGAEGAYLTSTPPLRRHTLGSDVAEQISGWSTIPADFSSNVLQNSQPSVVSNIAY
ncbi:GATA type zinc finger [Rhizoctonia solani]|uniref:GATA type zinc finger n=1 Tax=Rhizoctonia solani TaxID=456999 RepID=A0A8H8NM97_9AGAM|nr:GATA type zinc finger [Rhizoctonia solani]QRW16396.1 GATA type zinc finger [Rhizoctonia solani]